MATGLRRSKAANSWVRRDCELVLVHAVNPLPSSRPVAAEGDAPAASDWLDQQLAEAQAELNALEQAVEDLPHVLEVKYRQRLAAVVEANRQLQAQQQLLQQQCVPLPLPQHGSRWTRLRRLVAVQGIGLPPHRRRTVALIAGAAVAVAALTWAAARRWPLPPQRPALQGVAPAASAALPRATTSTLVLRALGSSWVEVQDLATREVLFIGVLEAGEERTIRLRRGLRLRSGRPDLLMLQVDDAAPMAFGALQGYGWRTVLPPVIRTGGA